MLEVLASPTSKPEVKNITVMAPQKSQDVLKCEKNEGGMT